jgi:MEMO1 family protein
MKTERNNLFNSLESPVPPIRQELQLFPVQHNGNTVLYFHDTLGYTPPNFALHNEAEPLLSLINGSMSISQIWQTVDGAIEKEQLLEFIQLLDKNCILSSPHYQITAENRESSFEASIIRPSSLAGESYPEDKDELTQYLNELFSGNGANRSDSQPKKAMYAPHIDPRVNQQIYADAFSALEGLSPKRVVILATAHYTGNYSDLYTNIPFIGSNKIFDLPTGEIPVDDSWIQTLSDLGDDIGFTTRDRAHRMEHSIEIHLLFARHIWNHDFSIVPILVNSFEELFYMPDGHLQEKIDRFTSTLRSLDDHETFYLVSGDLAHVGKKFGDRKPANSMKQEVEAFDEKFLASAITNQPDQLFEQVKQGYDPFRICGFPPLYTFLKLFPELNGELIGYHWWDEQERESAVSFGAIKY